MASLPNLPSNDFSDMIHVGETSHIFFIRLHKISISLKCDRKIEKKKKGKIGA